MRCLIIEFGRLNEIEFIPWIVKTNVETALGWLNIAIHLHKDEFKTIVTKQYNWIED